ncbi:Hypothetical protein D9617_28g064810 [Elsinoe fawcettii]|nr:Hypothetical protein D9617_28g064810 [Elsinoe fawcettii]
MQDQDSTLVKQHPDPRDLRDDVEIAGEDAEGSDDSLPKQRALLPLSEHAPGIRTASTINSKMVTGRGLGYFKGVAGSATPASFPGHTRPIEEAITSNEATMKQMQAKIVHTQAGKEAREAAEAVANARTQQAAASHEIEIALRTELRSFQTQLDTMTANYEASQKQMTESLVRECGHQSTTSNTETANEVREKAVSELHSAYETRVESLETAVDCLTSMQDKLAVMKKEQQNRKLIIAAHERAQGIG